jgi:hypothetical protein
LSYLILGIAILAGFLLAGRWYATADPRTLYKVLKWVLIGLVVAIALFFFFTGRMAWAVITLPALIPWLLRARAVARMAKTFTRMAQMATGAGGGASEIATEYLRMSLDHDSGRMSGIVTAGAFEGRRVEDLTPTQLLDLLAECKTHDAEGARLLEAYLDREHPDWRGGTENADPGGQGTTAPQRDMDRAEALKILGLAEGASDADIKEAHRRLIAGLHPDHGGSDYLAAQINRAKDILLKDRPRP